MIFSFSLIIILSLFRSKTSEPTTAAPSSEPTPTPTTPDPTSGPTMEPSLNPTAVPSREPTSSSPTATPSWLHEDQPEDCCQWRRVDAVNSHSIITAHYQYIWRATNTIHEYEDDHNQTLAKYPHAFEWEQLYNLSADPLYSTNLMQNEAVFDRESALGLLVEELRNLTREYVEDVCIAVSGECVVPGTNDSLGTAPPQTPGPTASPTTAAPTRRGRRSQRADGEVVALDVSVMNGEQSRDALMKLAGGGAIACCLLLIGWKWKCMDSVDAQKRRKGMDAESVSYGACL